MNPQIQIKQAIWALLLLLACPTSTNAFYDPTPGRWASRDTIEEEGGENLYVAAFNSPIAFIDPFGDCSCVCNKINISPDEKAFKISFYLVPIWDAFAMKEVLQVRLGFPISVSFDVTGDPKLCKYKIGEPKGGVSGSGPGGIKFNPSSGKNDNIQLDPKNPDKAPIGFDAPGIPISKPGKYTVNFDLHQTWTCEGSDGTKVIEKRHWKKTETMTYPPSK